MSRPAERLLAARFAESGYIRRPNAARIKEGRQEYKKGTEVRLVVETRAELAEVRTALRAMGLRPGRPFQKHTRFVQPVYGAEAAKWFARVTAERS